MLLQPLFLNIISIGNDIDGNFSRNDRMGEVRESIFFVFLIAVAIYTFSVFQSDFQDDFKISISGLLESYEEFERPSLKEEEAEEDAYDFDTERSCNQTFYEQSHGEGEIPRILFV